jgi:hypothetical protein
VTPNMQQRNVLVAILPVGMFYNSCLVSCCRARAGYLPLMILAVGGQWEVFRPVEKRSRL